MISGSARYGALPAAGLDLELDLSDLRHAIVGFGDKVGLVGHGERTALNGATTVPTGPLSSLIGRVDSARIPWARCSGVMRSTRTDPGGTEEPIAPPPRATGTARVNAPTAEPHPADPRPNRPSSRALRNPAPRRPVAAENGDPAVLVRPPTTPGGTSPSGLDPGPGAGGPPGRVPGPSRGGRRTSVPATVTPGGSDGGDEIWQLVRMAQAGDAQAFARIYDHYFDTVYRYISYRIGSRTVAEDLTSEVWLRALRRIGSVSWQGRDLGAWLVTIARNLIADHYKSGRQRLEVTTADMLDADEAAPGPEGQPEAAVLTRLDNATLLDAVRRLNPEQQECITLRFLQGLSVTETAQIMGKNDGAIKALQYRAVRTLGRLLPEGFTL